MRDIDDESYPEKKRRTYRCKDRMCGAEDCETCRPGCNGGPATADEIAEMRRLERIKNITCEFVCPPIPNRSHDWLAYVDGEDEGPQGWGKTKEEAIENLKEQINEN